MVLQAAQLEGRKIILGITGSIAAYKSAILLRLLIKAGADVKVIMTDSALTFVGALTFSTLSKHPVLNKLSQNQEWAQHVELGLWADLMIVSPATAHTISKFAHGLADNLLSAVYLSAKCPIMIAPAMDLDMWEHPSTQSNIEKLKSFGNHIIPVGEGPLASGLEGPGRLAEPSEIFEFVLQYFDKAQRFKGKRILITAGPSYEAIDPVRFIGNHSSGKMGIRLAEAALQQGAEVCLVLGPTQIPVPNHPQLTLIRTQSAEDIFNAVQRQHQQTDIFILAAAVADFKPAHTSKEKIKKDRQENMTIQLVPTIDIAEFVGKHKKDNQILCGFALETEHLVENASKKLHTKNMDLIVINSPKDSESAFGFDTNKISILDNSGKIVSFDLQTKQDAAKSILQALFERERA